MEGSPAIQLDAACLVVLNQHKQIQANDAATAEDGVIRDSGQLFNTV